MKLNKSLITILFLVCIGLIANAQITTIPFESQKSHFFINLKTANSDTLHFIFDTGSTGTSIDSVTAEKAGVDKINRTTVLVDSYDGTKKYTMAIHQQLKLNDLEIKDMNLVLADFKDLSATAGRRIDGVIGYEIMNRYVTQLDFDQKKLSLYNQIKEVDTAGYTSIPFEFRRGVNIPRFPISITLANNQKFTGRVMFDTGNAFPLIINASFSNYHKFKNVLGGNTASNVNGKNAVTATIKSMSFNGFRFDKMDVQLLIDDSAEPNGGSLGGLGIEIIKRFNVILDYKNQKIYLKPNLNYRDVFKVQEDYLKFRDENTAFLKKNATKPGIKVTASGLQYKIIKDGNGPKPRLTDLVAMHFTIRLINGDKMWSTYDNQKPWVHHLDKALPGVREAALLMPAGSKWVLYIPASLAFGTTGYDSVPPDATLIYELEILK